nr:hypothetical protein [Terribacillus saccharophilus]
MNKFLKIVLGVLSGVVILIAILAITFIIEMRPDSKQEEAIKNKADRYLNENFSENFEVFDALYDNMGNFEFEYAAKARNTKNDVEFLIYEDDNREIIDTYVSDKWAKDLESDIRPYLKDNLADINDYFAMFDDDIGQKLSIDSSNPENYKEHEVTPLIRINVARGKKEKDEKQFNDFVTYLKDEEILKHGIVIFSYVSKDGAILEEEEWRKEF